ncbi:hypothetical protein PHISCL_04453 [Aspergillus sclerotialis]|uniref:HMG box domain-containing protein n=1 Tax=Aspergillus sclerotialis TaxID=2070753 RepID=A0A3A2ZKX4_9EURO|nr:hypothetical protein PHISCL_04453 [Aspergillus sclerotialis]
MLDEQWKDQSEEVKAQYKAQAEQLKKKHAEDSPDYQAPSRQYKHVNVNGLVESPASATSVASNVSTSVMCTPFQPGNLGMPGNIHEVHGMNVVLGPKA